MGGAGWMGKRDSFGPVGANSSGSSGFSGTARPYHSSRLTGLTDSVIQSLDGAGEEGVHPGRSGAGVRALRVQEDVGRRDRQGGRRGQGHHLPRRRLERGPLLPGAPPRGARVGGGGVEAQDRKSVVSGKSVDLGGRRIIKKKTGEENRDSEEQQ